MPKTADQPSTPDAIVKTRKAGPGLMKPYPPSPELAAVVGPGPMSRTEVVAKVWAYIREHGLQDPDNKQAILADDKLRIVFGRDRCTMFEMQKLLSPHIMAAWPLSAAFSAAGAQHRAYDHVRRRSWPRWLAAHGASATLIP